MSDRGVLPRARGARSGRLLVEVSAGSTGVTVWERCGEVRFNDWPRASRLRYAFWSGRVSPGGAGGPGRSFRAAGIESTLDRHHITARFLVRDRAG